MKNIIKHYSNDQVTVVWQQSKCIHCGFCAAGLPDVFKPKQIPWINLEGAPADEIKRQVGDCPSGALSLG
jgi:uncharacterized Fe-S cluster protein YjdI